MTTIQIDRLGDGNLWSLYVVLQRLRTSDEEEFELFGVGPLNFVDALTNGRVLPHGFVASLDGLPVFAFGAVEHTPGVCQLWGFGTDKTPRVLPAVTQFIFEKFGPELFRLGARRVQVLVPLKSKRSFQWLTEHLGMRVETIMPDYCTDGSPMAQLVYTRKEYEEYVQYPKHFRNTKTSSSESSAARD